MELSTVSQEGQVMHRRWSTSIFDFLPVADSSDKGKQDEDSAKEKSTQVSISYRDDAKIWKVLEPALMSRMPLCNLTWTSHVGLSQTIPELALRFYNFNDVHWKIPSPLDPNHVRISEWHRIPFIYFYLLTCEDLDTYRSKTRQAVKKWVDDMNEKQYEWLVIYVPIGTRATPTESMENSGGKVYKKIYEKIKSEFFFRREGDRTCKLDILDGGHVQGALPGQQPQHEADWSELLSKMRELVTLSFNTRYKQYEEYINLFNSQPEWKFKDFFVEKDCLAKMYFQMHLYDDAIRHYDELEALLESLSVANSNSSPSMKGIHFSTFSSSHPFFVQPLSSICCNSLQDQIRSDSISVSVSLLRGYLVLRQMAILFKLARLKDVLYRVDAFIIRCVQQMHLHSDIDHFNVSKWTVSTHLDIAITMETWLKSLTNVDSEKTDAATLMLGELLHTVRHELEVLSKQCFSSTEKQSESITQERLLTQAHAIIDHALSSFDVYQFAHLDLSRKIASLFQKAGRKRFAAKLWGDCADYYMRNKEYENALHLYRSQLGPIASDAWNALSYPVLQRISQCEKNLDYQSAYVSTCLRLLHPVFTRYRGKPESEEIWNSVCGILKMLNKETESPRFLEPYLFLGLQPLGKVRASCQKLERQKNSFVCRCLESVVKLQIQLFSQFPVNLVFDDVKLRLWHSTESNEIREVCLPLQEFLFVPVGNHSSICETVLQAPGFYKFQSIEFFLGPCTFHMDMNSLLNAQERDAIPRELTLCTEFHIHPLSSSLMFDVHLPPVLIPNVPQEGVILMNPQDDSISNVILNLATGENVRFGKQVVIQQYLRETDQTIFKEVLSTRNNESEIPLPTCSSDASIRVAFSIEVLTHENHSPCKGRVTMQYTQMILGTSFCSSREHLIEVPIEQPLKTNIFMTRLDNKIFANIVLLCNSTVPIVFHGVSIQEPVEIDTDHVSDGGAVLETIIDPNQELKGSKLCIGESLYLAFIFHCRRPVPKLCTDGSFQVTYSLSPTSCDETNSVSIIDPLTANNSSLAPKYTFCSTLSFFSAPPEPVFRVSLAPLSFQEQGKSLPPLYHYEGSLILMELRIEWLSGRSLPDKQVNSCVDLAYTFELDDVDGDGEVHWLMSGKARGTLLALETGACYTTQCQLLPMHSGMLQLPRVTLELLRLRDGDSIKDKLRGHPLHNSIVQYNRTGVRHPKELLVLPTGHATLFTQPWHPTTLPP